MQLALSLREQRQRCTARAQAQRCDVQSELDVYEAKVAELQAELSKLKAADEVRKASVVTEA